MHVPNGGAPRHSPGAPGPQRGDGADPSRRHLDGVATGRLRDEVASVERLVDVAFAAAAAPSPPLPPPQWPSAPPGPVAGSPPRPLGETPRRRPPPSAERARAPRGHAHGRGRVLAGASFLAAGALVACLAGPWNWLAIIACAAAVLATWALAARRPLRPAALRPAALPPASLPASPPARRRSGDDGERVPPRGAGPAHAPAVPAHAPAVPVPVPIEGRRVLTRGLAASRLVAAGDPAPPLPPPVPPAEELAEALDRALAEMLSGRAPLAPTLPVFYAAALAHSAQLYRGADAAAVDFARRLGADLARRYGWVPPAPNAPLTAGTPRRP